MKRELRRALARISILFAVISAFGVTAGASEPTIQKLFVDVAAVMEKLGAGLGFNEAEWAAMLAEAHAFKDPKSGLPVLTARGRALVYYVFEPSGDGSDCAGTPKSVQSPQTVLFLGGVHTDEISPLYSSFHLLLELVANPSKRPERTRVVFAPLVNPDGLLGVETKSGRTRVATRENAHGVDLNRDLGTAHPQTESRFVQWLIATYQPSHIVSLHGPFGWLDYDGPAKNRSASKATKAHVEEWLTAIQKAGREKLPIKPDFETYPGSLGHYAGEKLREHVLTIEFPTKSPHEGADDWYKYGDSLRQAIEPPATE